MQLCRLRTGLPECRIPLCKLIPPAVSPPVSPLRAELSLTLNKESDPSGMGRGGREGVRPRRKDSRAPDLLVHHYSRNGSCRETGARCWLPKDKPATRSSVGWGWGAGASVENRLQRREGSRTESAYLSLASAFGVSEGTSWSTAPNSRTMEERSVSEHRSYPASVRLCTGEPGSSGPPSRRRLDGHWTVAGCVGRAPTSP